MGFQVKEVSVLMAARLPAKISYDTATYPLKTQLGQGGSGVVGLYGSEAMGYVVLKISYCNDPEGFRKAQSEIQHAQEVAALPACDPQDVMWRRNAAAAFSPRSWLRVPLASNFQNGCAYALYEFIPQNLAQWLQSRPRRRPDDVVAMFLQITSILRCLKRRGFAYDDLKPSNLLVKQDAALGVPRVVIGDLGGLDRQGDSQITVTPSRLPRGLLRGVSWQNVDVLTSFLLGEIILQLLLRPTLAGERHVMNEFLKCTHMNGDVDSCTSELMKSLRGGLADGLSFEDPRIRDLAALALNFLGYKGNYIGLDEASALPSPLWSS